MGEKHEEKSTFNASLRAKEGKIIASEIRKNELFCVQVEEKNS